MNAIRGRVEIIHHESRLLADNPLADPATRELGVYLPPSYDDSSRRYPVILFLPGYAGAGLQLLNRGAWQLPLDQRMDQLVRSEQAKEAILVFPDCFTRYGGSQYVDSPAIGRYASYLSDEIVPFIDARYRSVAAREGRGLIGKSSGGWGALHLAMTRPDLFGAAASHAGDCAFEVSYRSALPLCAVALGRDGSVANFLRRFESMAAKSSADIEVMSTLCCAAAWSPRDRGPYRFGEGFDLPFDPGTGALEAKVWQRWLAFDPLTRVSQHANALRRLSLLFLDAGRNDEYALQLGARQLSSVLSAAKVPHQHEEFEGGHRHTQHRYARSLELMTKALTL